MARKTELTPTVQHAIIKLIEDGKTQEETALILGIAAQTLSEWKKKDQQLAEAIAKAKVRPDDLVEAALFERATGFIDREGKHYPPDPASLSLWLRNRRPERWREKQEIEISTQLKEMSDEDFRKFKDEVIKEYLDAQAKQESD